MFLGIDVGTGGTRAVLVGRNGGVLASYAQEHAPIHSAQIGWAEQDPEDWWRAAQRAISQTLKLAADAGHAGAVEAIGLTGQMHGCVLLDADGEVLRPAMIWCDQRTQAEADWLNQTVGRERLIQLVANPALPNFTLTKLLWVRAHEPALYARIAHVLCPKDYVRFRLTGEYAMDVQEASGTLLLDVVHRRWSEEVAAVAGVPLSWLPRLFESPKFVAASRQQERTRQASPRGRPSRPEPAIRVRVRSVWASLRPDPCRPPSAPPAWSSPPQPSPRSIPGAGSILSVTPSPGVWHVMGVTNGAGLSLRYLRDAFLPGQSYEELSELAAGVPPGSDGLLWAPYLFGERTPYLDPDARAAFAGITASTTTAHYVRAVLEGVAYSLQDSFTLLHELRIPVESIRLGGGGARGALWRQIQADVYGQPVQRLEAEEGGAFGAALLAGTGVGAWRSVEAACAATVRAAETLQPLHKETMAAGYLRYRRLYPALRQVFASTG